MIRAINLSKRIDFVAEDDPGKGTEDATIFHLKVLTSWQLAVVNDMLASFNAAAISSGDGSNADMKIHQAAILAAQMGLDGWTNYNKEDGSPVEFVTERKTFGGRTGQYIKGDLLDAIPMAVLFGIYRALMESSSPSETELKNSAAA